MNAKTIVRDIDRHSHILKVSSWLHRRRGGSYKVSRCLYPFFLLFFSLGQTWKHQPSWFSQQASHHTTLSSYIAWLLAGVLCKVDFPHCIAMHALLVKVRIEVNSFLFHVKSKHTVSSYCVQVSYQVPWGRLNFKILLHLHVLASHTWIT